MATHAHTHHVSPTSLPTIRRVSGDRPWYWLAAGWEDVTRAPGVSMGYGFFVSAFMVFAFYLLQAAQAYYLAIGLMAGFVFIGPVLAVGIYELSRRMENHKPASIPDSWHGWQRNSSSVMAVGVILVLMMLAWLMLSMQLSAVMFGIGSEAGSVFGNAAGWRDFVFSIQWPLVVAFGLVGAFAVAITYVLTVVAVPMLTDKEDMDVITAMVTSFHTVRRNAAAMGLWAVLLATFTAIAVVPLFLGLIVVFPLLAHASWHAYRDLIEH